jgi:hypothetical protein
VRFRQDDRAAVTAVIHHGRRWAIGGLAAAAALTLPALALAKSLNDQIPNGYYATVIEQHVPSGEDVEFTLRNHSYLSTLTLGCAPNATNASLISDSGYANILNWAGEKKVALRNGNFSYSGPAKVTAAYDGAPKVATATLTISGHYVPHGKVYHYLGSLDNQVTATLVFEGTASSAACANLPKGHKFLLYSTVSSGGD